MKIQPDKIKHFIAGAIIAPICLFIGLSSAWTLGIVAVIGALKELRDLCGYGSPDIMDLVWTIAGAVPLCLLSFLVFGI